MIDFDKTVKRLHDSYFWRTWLDVMLPNYDYMIATEVSTARDGLTKLGQQIPPSALAYALKHQIQTPNISEFLYNALQRKLQ
jgi:hypothetical protein